MSVEAQIINFEPTKENSLLLAATYGRVYAAEPWLEVYRSKKCGRFFGPQFALGENCPTTNCDQLQVAYPLEETAERLLEEVSQPGTLAKVVMYDGQIAGFGIGRPYSYEQFARERYGTTDAQEEMLAFFDSIGLYGPAYYIDEVGIEEALRGQRLSSRMTDMMAVEAQARKLPLLMRTFKTSPMVENAYRVGMGQIMGPRSVVSRDLVMNGTGMKVNKEIIVLDQVVRQLDPLNEDRVIFGSPKPRC